jgi:hypothetical protein
MSSACDAASPREEEEEALEQPLTWSDHESGGDMTAE